MTRPPGIVLRPVAPEDGGFLRELHADVHGDALKLLPAAARARLVEMQYKSQKATYEREFPDAEAFIIECLGVPVGQITLSNSPSAKRIVDFSLLSTTRGRGIGSATLRSVLADSDTRGIPTELRCARTNPALSLYKRFEFQVQHGTATHVSMRRKPSGA